MSEIPTGTEMARPFIPTKDIDVSKAFYEALGFEIVFDGEVAIFRIGSTGFILQRYYQKEWAENFMMQLVVDDVDAWWEHIRSLDLPTKFGVAPPRAPALQLGESVKRTSSIRAGYFGMCRSGKPDIPQGDERSGEVPRDDPVRLSAGAAGRAPEPAQNRPRVFANVLVPAP